MEKRGKEGKINLSSFVFCPTVYLATLNVYLALIQDEKFVAENLLGEKEKWTNKRNDKQQHVDSLLRNTTSHIQHLYQISKS